MGKKRHFTFSYRRLIVRYKINLYLQRFLRQFNALQQSLNVHGSRDEEDAMALSLRGIARRYGNVTGAFSVAQAIVNGTGTGTVSLRSRLESMARKEVSLFEQIWSHIKIRIRLNPDGDIDIPPGTLDTLKATWQQGIEDTWSNQWGVGRSDELTCPLTFEVVWVNTNEHHTVRVNTGIKCMDAMGNPIRCQTNKSLWHTSDAG